MDLEIARKYCLSLAGTSEDFPFDETTLVFRVGAKIFAITDVESHPISISLKCDPLRAIELREQHPCIKAGYHLNKKHWNSLEDDGSLSDKFFFEMFSHSYNLVFNGLSRKEKEEIKNISKNL